MIRFESLNLEEREKYDAILRAETREGCEYNPVNIFLWGRQKVAILDGLLTGFAQVNRKSVYLMPAGQGDKETAIRCLMEDAGERGIPFRLVGITKDDEEILEKMQIPGLQYHCDRDAYDYIYDIHKLADLSGKKLQSKRNHLNRFRDTHPDHSFEPITKENEPQVRAVLRSWYEERQETDPTGDFTLELAAMRKALANWDALRLEGILLRMEGQPVAVAIGSRMNEDTFDIHFEKALRAADGTYAAINNGFARYLREKYPELRWINREDDMGIPGLRKAKCSYRPDHMVEKSWVQIVEDGLDY